MKKIRTFITKSIIFSIVLPATLSPVAVYTSYQLEVLDLEQDESLSYQSTEIQNSAVTKEMEYEINSDLGEMEPANWTYFTTVLNELAALKRLFPNQETIDFSSSRSPKDFAPTIYPLLKGKMEAIAGRMGLDVSNIDICIQPTPADNRGLFNAHAQQIKHTLVSMTAEVEKEIDQDGNVISQTVSNVKVNVENTKTCKLSINEETLILVAWLEGLYGYETKEGLIDGVIAHELSHIFHNHTDPKAECEKEADATAARSLLHPENVINAVDALYFAGNLFDSLKNNQSLLRLDDNAILRAIYIILKTLIKHNSGIGALSLASSHAQFSNEIQKAVLKAVEHNKLKHLFEDKKIISLIYDELKDLCSRKELPSTGTREELMCKAFDKTLSLYSELTHPAPKERRQAWASAVAISQLQLS